MVSNAKVQLFFDIRKFCERFLQNIFIFAPFWDILDYFSQQTEHFRSVCIIL